jgi:uncharacterized repeat protein (TIGR04076 family)
LYELKICVSKVMGTCTADPPMKSGDYFSVRDGDIRIPEGGYICAWALQNLLPMIPAKERQICEAEGDDWMERVHHAQCPDPAGRVIFKYDRKTLIDKAEKHPRPLQTPPLPRTAPVGDSGTPHDLRVVVDEVRGKCTSGMLPGDYFLLNSGRLTIPPERHFCLYALQAVLPFLAAKQRQLEDGDWLKDEAHFICPDPAGNVILRIEPLTNRV